MKRSSNDLPQERDQEWMEQDEDCCLRNPMLNNFRNFASDLSQDDEAVEKFFWVVSGENAEYCNIALKVLILHRNELAKKVARELLADVV